MLLVFPTSLIMLKRQANAPKTARKKKKGNATYSTISLDPSSDDEKMVTEDIRVWDISASNKTGRVAASRTTLKHCYQVSPSLPDVSSAGERPGVAEGVTDVDEAGVFADSESPSKTVNKKRSKRKRARVHRENDSVSELIIFPAAWAYSHFQTKMEQWLQHCPVILDECLCHDGLGDMYGGLGPCPDCSKCPAQFKCKDCFGGIMRCSACIVSSHQNLPLHRIQVRQVPPHRPELTRSQLWNGSFFEHATLKGLGLVINLIHSTDICPVGPETQRINVIDISSYHIVRVRFCMCSHSSFLESFRQLLRVSWFPASILRPKTVFTFDLLDTYHKISMQGKLNLYDFYTMIMQKTDNCGRWKVKVSVGLSVALTLQLRFVDSTGITKCHAVSDNGITSRTSNGVQPVTPLWRSKILAMVHSQLSVQHAHTQGGICLQNGRMHPRTKCMSFSNFCAVALDDVHRRWLFSLFIAIDANFRLKLKSRGIKDPELGSGLAYFVNAGKFETHLKGYIDEDDVSVSDLFLLLDQKFTHQEIETCGTEFHAVNQANLKQSKDFTVSGVGAVVCRHGLVRKNGVVDLQKGER